MATLSLSTTSTLCTVLRDALARHRRERDACVSEARAVASESFRTSYVAMARRENSEVVKCLKAYRELFLA